MTLTVEVQRSLASIALRRGTNAFTSHVPTDLSDRNQLLQCVQRAQARRENAPNCDHGLSLDGQLVAVKDNFWTLHFPTTCGSAVLQRFRTPGNANVVDMLEENGMKVVGKTNMDEFAMGSHSLNSRYGRVCNDTVSGHPRSAGGSSGGSAMAVLNGQCRVALGTDTGGSVRLPASYTGLFGFKPSYGVLSRNGVVPHANSLDTVGIIGRNTEDILRTFCKLVDPSFRMKRHTADDMEVHTNRYDPQDPTCLKNETRSRITAQKKDRLERKMTKKHPSDHAELGPGYARGVATAAIQHQSGEEKFSMVSDWSRTIGVPVEYNIKEMVDSVREAWMRTLAQLESYGHTIVPISLPHTKAALAAYYVLAPAEASSNLAKYDGVRYGPAVDYSVREQRPAVSGSGKTIPAKEWRAADDDSVLFARIRGEAFGHEVQRRVLLGTYTLSSAAKDSYFVQAQKVRRLVQQDFDDVFKIANSLHAQTSSSMPSSSSGVDGVDYIICPTAPTPAPRLHDRKGRLTSLSDPSASISTYTTDLFTVAASLAGIPAISIPAPPTPNRQDSDHLHIGVQVMAQYGDDFGLLRFVQRELDYDWKKPSSNYASNLGRGKKKWL